MVEMELDAGIMLSKADGSVSSFSPPAECSAVSVDVPLTSGAEEFRDRQSWYALKSMETLCLLL